MIGSAPLDLTAEAAYYLERQIAAVQPSVYWEAHARKLAREYQAAQDRGEHVLAAALDAAMTLALAQAARSWPTR